MAANRQIAVIEEPRRLVLSGLPFPSGTRVEVSIEEAYVPRSEEGRAFAALFDQIDASAPHRLPISDEEIAAEIAAYRAGR